MKNILLYIVCSLIICTLFFQGCHDGHSEAKAGPPKEAVADSIAGNKPGHDKPAVTSLDTVVLLKELKENPNIRQADFNITKTIETANGQLLLLEGSSGTCASSYLTLYKQGKIIKCAELRAECDDDLSQAVYEYKSYSAQRDTIFTVATITQTVKNKRLIDKNGDLKGHISRDDVEMKNDTVLTRVSPSFLLTKTPDWPRVWE